MVFGTQLVVNNIIEVAFPLIGTWWSARANRVVEKDGQEKPKTEPETEYELGLYESTFEDFDEMAIQFGYVCLFVVAFPLAPLLALINNYVEIRLDAQKLTSMCRRPPPDAAANIGTWYTILSVISVLAVVTNMLLVCFETTLIKTWSANSLLTQVVVFVISEHVVLMIKFLIAYVVDDEPLWVRQGIERQEYLVEVLINGVEEEEEELMDQDEEEPQAKTADFTPDSVDKELSEKELTRLNHAFAPGRASTLRSRSFHNLRLTKESKTKDGTSV
jgi:anoctamin-10/anoctamin-7